MSADTDKLIHFSTCR